MNIFLDSNVLVDWLLNRTAGFPHEASRIMEACESGQITGYVSAPSFYLVAYLLEKAGKKNPELRMLIENVLQMVIVTPQSNTQIKRGLELGLTDTEDGFQLAAAITISNCSYFVTANTKDFPADVKNLKVIHTRDFVSLLK